MPRPLAQWKQHALQHIRSYATTQLLAAVIEDAVGDDWDGGFTDRGRWMFDAEASELRCRLWMAGIIDSHD